jgi:hypothetical protein
LPADDDERDRHDCERHVDLTHPAAQFDCGGEDERSECRGDWQPKQRRHAGTDDDRDGHEQQPGPPRCKGRAVGHGVRGTRGVGGEGVGDHQGHGEDDERHAQIQRDDDGVLVCPEVGGDGHQPGRPSGDHPENSGDRVEVTMQAECKPGENRQHECRDGYRDDGRPVRTQRDQRLSLHGESDGHGEHALRQHDDWSCRSRGPDAGDGEDDRHGQGGEEIRCRQADTRQQPPPRQGRSAQ